MYRCGHSFHARCLEATEECPICYKQELKEKRDPKNIKNGNDLIAIPEGKLSKYYRMEKDISSTTEFLRSFDEDATYTSTILNLAVPSQFKPTQRLFRRDMKLLPPKAATYGEIDDFQDLLE
jgi:hypothetical protein